MHTRNDPSMCTLTHWTLANFNIIVGDALQQLTGEAPAVKAGACLAGYYN